MKRASDAVAGWPKYTIPKSSLSCGPPATSTPGLSPSCSGSTPSRAVAVVGRIDASLAPPHAPTPTLDNASASRTSSGFIRAHALSQGLQRSRQQQRFLLLTLTYGPPHVKSRAGDCFSLGRLFLTRPFHPACIATH